MAKLWVEQLHPEYADTAERNRYAEDHYTGEAAEKARVFSRSLTETSPVVPTIGHRSEGLYLPRRPQGEAVGNYQDRVQVSRFPRIMGRVVSAHTGSLWQVEQKAKRTWGEEGDDGQVIAGLGDPDEDGTVMSRLWEDVDGNGTNYEALLTQSANDLQVYKGVWYFVEPPREDGEDARVSVFHPNDVTNWIEEEGRLTQVLVREQHDTREELEQVVKDEEIYEEIYVKYSLDGWDRYRVVTHKEDGKKVREIEHLEDQSGFWSQPFFDRKGNQRLPIGYKSLTEDYHLGYELGKDANYLWNLLSDPRNLSRLIGGPKLKFNDGDPAAVTAFNTSEQQIQKGSNLLMGPWDFISPDASFITIAYEFYREEAKAVLADAFQRANDVAAERTATEVRHDDNAGRASFLTLLARALDEIENDILYLLSQIYFPSNQDLWDTAHVTRSRDFKPIDAPAEAERIVQTFFPMGVDNIPPNVKATLMQMLLDLLNVQYEPEDIEAAAEVEDLISAQERAAIEALNSQNGLDEGVTLQ